MADGVESITSAIDLSPPHNWIDRPRPSSTQVLIRRPPAAGVFRPLFFLKSHDTHKL